MALQERTGYYIENTGGGVMCYTMSEPVNGRVACINPDPLDIEENQTGCMFGVYEVAGGVLDYSVHQDYALYPTFAECDAAARAFLEGLPPVGM